MKHIEPSKYTVSAVMLLPFLLCTQFSQLVVGYLLYRDFAQFTPSYNVICLLLMLLIYNCFNQVGMQYWFVPCASFSALATCSQLLKRTFKSYRKHLVEVRKKQTKHQRLQQRLQHQRRQHHQHQKLKKRTID